MSDASGGTRPGTWPADVIHVNEDGWVLINRGQRAGVVAGSQLLVVGSGVRALRNLFAQSAADSGDTAGEEPVVLRIRRTYEQLEVVYTEAECAIAVATRTPHARRPSFYRGPGGELLVWVPLPEGYTFPPPDADTTTGEDAGGEPEEQDAPLDEAADAADEPAADLPPETGEQDDKRWEEALPLNGVTVGDLVVPAQPVNASAGQAVATGVVATAPAPSGAEPQANPFEAGQSYDWLKQGE